MDAEMNVIFRGMISSLSPAGECQGYASLLASEAFPAAIQPSVPFSRLPALRMAPGRTTPPPNVRLLPSLKSEHRRCLLPLLHPHKQSVMTFSPTRSPLNLTLPFCYCYPHLPTLRLAQDRVGSFQGHCFSPNTTPP